MRCLSTPVLAGLLIAATSLLGLHSATAQTTTKPSQSKRPLTTASAPTRAEAQSPWSMAGKLRLNEWTVGIAAGRTEGAPLRLAAELARVLDDGERMRVIPMVTRGPFDNMADLLLLKGVDAAILMGDTLEHFETVEKVPRLHDRVNYIASLFPSEVHILVRPEINTIEDLAGKQVNFNTPGTAAAYTGPLIFKKLGIAVKATFEPHQAVMTEIVKNDTYAATFWVTTKPIDPLAKREFPAGFKLLAVPYTKDLEDLYMPAALEHKDYPKLIPEGQKIQTVSVPAVLAIYNWGPGTERHKRQARFIDYLFERLPLLQKAPFDPAWRSVNLQAPVPGWRRYSVVQRKLDQAVKIRQATSGLPATAN